jgi:hypothetical protein
MTNTYDLKQVWDEEYELSLFKQPTFRIIAETKFEKNLKIGNVFHRTGSGDFVVNPMGANGSYNVQSFADIDETLTVNIKNETSFQLVEWQEVQAHLPTARKYGRKAANALGLQMDADILAAASANAANYIDDGTLSGTAGNPLALTSGNVASLFSQAIATFQSANVSYDPNARFTKDVQLEKIGGMASAIITPAVYQQILQYVGGKTTILGDTVTRNGHVGEFMGFNLFVSNNLEFTATLTLGAAPTNGDTFTIAGVTFTFVTTLGSTPGNILFTNATDATTNLKAALANPYTTTSTFIGLTQGALNANAWVGIKKILNNVSTSGTATTTVITIKGTSNAAITSNFTSASNTFNTASGASSATSHIIFAVGKVVSLICQKYPSLYINPVSGSVAKDFATWNLYGYASFQDQTPAIIDARISAGGLKTTPQNYAN